MFFSVDLYVVIHVSGKHIGPIFMSHSAQGERRKHVEMSQAKI